MARETLEEVLTAAGLTAVWEARGRMKGRAEGEAKGLKEALEMLRSGKTPKEIEKMYEDVRRKAAAVDGRKGTAGIRLRSSSPLSVKFGVMKGEPCIP
ncbi:MAG: hypothetical protein LBP76_11365 [Treponema sp.]|nr:hypothetical protein [Treponema sp.]